MDDVVIEVPEYPEFTKYYRIPAKRGSTCVGHVYLYIHADPVNQPKEKHCAFVEDLLVDESARGKGIARKLMEELKKLAVKEGVPKIVLTCNPKRVAARKLYASMGFVFGPSEKGELKL